MSSPENPRAGKSGLHEYVDVRFSIPELETPADEKRLFDVLVALPSVCNLSVVKGEAMLEYEPVILSQEHLVQAISGAGFTIAKTESTSASILTDALSEKETIEAPNDPEESSDDDSIANHNSRNGVVSRS